MDSGDSNERNNLFPVFVKLEELNTLIVGGGNVGLEKVTGILKSCPGARITVVARKILDEVKLLTKGNPKVVLVERDFRSKDLLGKDLVILATGDHHLNVRIKALARKRKLLVNVADTPQLCDFYLGAVVTKGNLKIGISTNGKSPTLAKRMREFFEEVLPDSTNQLLDNLHNIRDQVKGDFKEKVAVLNEITASWLKRR